MDGSGGKEHSFKWRRSESAAFLLSGISVRRAHMGQAGKGYMEQVFDKRKVAGEPESEW